MHLMHGSIHLVALHRFNCGFRYLTILLLLYSILYRLERSFKLVIRTWRMLTNYNMMNTTHSLYVVPPTNHSTGNPHWLYSIVFSFTMSCSVKPQEKCPLCQASYVPDYKGKMCKVWKASVSNIFITTVYIHCNHITNIIGMRNIWLGKFWQTIQVKAIGEEKFVE